MHKLVVNKNDYLLACSVWLIVILQENFPPIMSFHLGSLGFLTPFQFSSESEDGRTNGEWVWFRVWQIVVELDFRVTQLQGAQIREDIRNT